MPMNPPAVLTAGQPPSCVRQGGHPLGDAEQAEPADEQRGPADLGRRQGRIAVRVTEEPPADQGEQDRDGERPLAHDRAGERVDARCPPGCPSAPRWTRRTRSRARGRTGRCRRAGDRLPVRARCGRTGARSIPPPTRSAARPSRPRGRTSAPGSPPGPWSAPASAAPRLVAAPFLAAADLAAAHLPVPPRPVPARRALFPLDPAAPPRLDPLAPRPRAAYRRRCRCVPVPVPPPRAPDRLAEVRDPAPRPEPAAAPLRPPPDVPDVPERPDLLIPRTMSRTRCRPPARPPRGGTLGRITSGDSSL